MFYEQTGEHYLWNKRHYGDTVISKTVNKGPRTYKDKHYMELLWSGIDFHVKHIKSV